jgi:uncharacterized membrane protein YuzA (DUF378 family)
VAEEGIIMHAPNVTTLLLVSVAGLSWFLVGGQTSDPSRIVCMLAGLSAIWQAMPFVGAFGRGAALAERSY